MSSAPARTPRHRARATRRALLLTTATSGLLGIVVAGASPAHAGTKPDFCDHDQRTAPMVYLCAKPGDIVDVRIGDVHPTQPSLGYDEVYYKLGRYTLGKDTINKKFADWCEASGLLDAVAAQPDARLDDPSSFTCALQPGQETAASRALMKTVVIGAGGSLWLTDGHHTLTSFAEMPDGGMDAHVRLLVAGNLSRLTRQDFWTAMKANKRVWLEDPAGQPVGVNKLPNTVGLANFANDPGRSLLYFARDIGYSAGTVPFQEFYWGAWLRTTTPVDLSGWNPDDAASYLDAVTRTAYAQVALAKDGQVYGGFSAADLGALPAVNTKELAKLAKPLSDAKPGKIAYMEAYKAPLAH